MNDVKADEFQYRFELLKQEIEILQARIGSYDTILLTIRGWTITIFSAFIFFSAQAKQPIYLIFCALSVMLFWLVEAIFRRYQRSFIYRYTQIEQFLQSQEFAQAVAERSFKNFVIPNLRGAYATKRKEHWLNILHTVRSPSTALLYVAMLSMTIGLAILMVVWKP